MNVFISLLRGVNVGGHNKIPMAELKRLYESLDLTNVRTYLQSGNVVFESGEQAASKLAVSIEAAIEQAFGRAVAVLVMDARDFQRIVDGNPFLYEGNETTPNLYVTFLYANPSTLTLSNLDSYLDSYIDKIDENKTDEFRVAGKAIFLFCPQGYGRTRISNDFFERKLGVPATTRNWNTVLALQKMTAAI